MPKRKNLAKPEEAEQTPEQLAPPIQGRMEPDHGPLTDDLISPEDAQERDAGNTEPDEVDAFGNRLEHEGEWTQEPAGDLTDEDVADTHDWRQSPSDPKANDRGWNNEKKPSS